MYVYVVPHVGSFSLFFASGAGCSSGKPRTANVRRKNDSTEVVISHNQGSGGQGGRDNIRCPVQGCLTVSVGTVRICLQLQQQQHCLGVACTGGVCDGFTNRPPEMEPKRMTTERCRKSSVCVCDQRVERREKDGCWGSECEQEKKLELLGGEGRAGDNAERRRGERTAVCGSHECGALATFCNPSIHWQCGRVAQQLQQHVRVSSLCSGVHLLDRHRVRVHNSTTLYTFTLAVIQSWKIHKRLLVPTFVRSRRVGGSEVHLSRQA
jgi:hypothetical protein